jgi:Ser/Thr protein kinase RdoA (MazF antagonist)
MAPDAILRAPALTAAEAVDLARRLYGIDAQASALPGERDQNFLLQTADGGRFVLKVANATDDRALLEAQNEALGHVGRVSSLCPRPVPALDGTLLTEITSASGVRHFVRVLTWVAGEPLATVQHRTADLLEQLGERVGELDVALDGFDHPAIHRVFYWDLAGGLAIVRRLAPLIPETAMRALVTRTASAIETRDSAGFERLKRAAAHNDPNDYNVLVDLGPEGRSSLMNGHRQIAGILDFGDIVHTYAIADLAGSGRHRCGDRPRLPSASPD